MKLLNQLVIVFGLVGLVGCGGGSSSTMTPPPPVQGSAQVSVSIHDIPPMGVTVLSFQATVTGISMQPGNISLLNAPMTVEMTQLQAMSAYMGTIAVPAGTYTGMTITFTNPRMTFRNDTGSTMGGMMGGMMGGGSCAIGQICQLTPTMMASSVTLTGSPFPLNVQDNSPFNLQMDFDLMDSMQSNMSMNPTMSSMMQQGLQGSSILDEMDDLLGQVSSVDAANGKFQIAFVQGMPSMSVTVDSNTMFQGFDSISKPNSISGIAAGQIVLTRMQLMAGGALHADKVRFQSNNPQVMDGMIVAINSSTQFDMVMMNEAPAFQGVNIGDVLRMNMQAGSMFDVDDTDLPVSAMSFAGMSDMMVGQMVQIEPTSALVPGTPAQLNTNHLRLMKTWMTATVASKIDANTFTVNNLPGMFGAGGTTAMRISCSPQTVFDGISSASSLSVGDTVSVRGPMFLPGGTATIVAGKVMKR
jgi:Domain of unknown function (DUF4382)/Domain of unknown function (DUF5666)